VVAYCPCIAHGIRGGMAHSLARQRLAVATGLVILFRYAPPVPAQASAGPLPPHGVLTIDSPAPSKPVDEFLQDEVVCFTVLLS